jgi:nucleoid-associated protein YgaU
VYEVSEGDRLDWIAYQEYNDAREWRRIAEANHITNPLALRPGMMLVIPPR